MQGGAEYCGYTSMRGRWTQIPLLQLWSFGPRQLGQGQKGVKSGLRCSLSRSSKQLKKSFAHAGLQPKDSVYDTMGFVNA